MKKKLPRFLPLVLLTLLGLLAGFLYYRFVGCADGTCAITSNPLASTLYGGAIGLLLGIVFTPKRAKDPDGE